MTSKSHHIRSRSDFLPTYSEKKLSSNFSRNSTPNLTSEYNENVASSLKSLLNMDNNQSKTFNGNVQQKKPPSSDVELMYSRAQIKKIIQECKLKTIRAQKKANFYRILNIISNLFIILATLFIGIIETQRQDKRYTYIILSFLVSLIETLHIIFRLGQRGVYFKYASIKYQKLLTVANETLFYSTNKSDLTRLIHQFRSEIDELSFSLYKVSYGQDSMKSRNNINLDSGENQV